MQPCLDIKNVLTETAEHLQNHGPALMRSALLPAILIATTYQIPDFVEFTLFYNIAFALIQTACVTLYMVPVLRGVLLGERGIGRRWGLRWGWAETRFMLRYFLLIAVPLGTFLVLLVLAFLLIPPSMRDAVTAHWGMNVLGVVYMTFNIYVIVRLSMMLPAAAIGEPANPLLAWQLTRNNGWRLLGLYVLILLVLSVLLLLLGLTLLLLDHPIVHWVIDVFGLLIGIVSVAATAVAYRELTASYGQKVAAINGNQLQK